MWITKILVAQRVGIKGKPSMHISPLERDFIGGTMVKKMGIDSLAYKVEQEKVEKGKRLVVDEEETHSMDEGGEQGAEAGIELGESSGHDENEHDFHISPHCPSIPDIQKSSPTSIAIVLQVLQGFKEEIMYHRNIVEASLNSLTTCIDGLEASVNVGTRLWTGQPSAGRAEPFPTVQSHRISLSWMAEHLHTGPKISQYHFMAIHQHKLYKYANHM